MSRYHMPGSYLPHDEPMILLDTVVNVTDTQAVCRVAVNESGALGPFINHQGNLPGWYALELMAQTVGVWSGWHRQQRNENQISLGMVLGARELKCALPAFAHDSKLEITVTLLMQDQRIGSFECAIASAGLTCASGRINTFQPTAEELTTLFKQEVSS